MLCLAGALGAAENLDLLKPHLLRFHPRLTEFGLVSSCQVDASHSVVVVRGTVSEDRIEGNAGDPAFFRQEAFGVFVVDGARRPLIELDVFPSQRWWDYKVVVEECPPGSALVTGQGATYGDQCQRVLYFYDLRKQALISRIPHDPVSIERIEPLGGALYFIGPAIALRFDPARPERSEVADAPAGITARPSARLPAISLPQPDWETFRKLRPGRVSDGYTQDAKFHQEVGPFQQVADRVWFGVTFYDGEGTTGVGGLGWFDTVNRSVQMRYLPELADWSASAILADQDEVWLGLVRHPEGADMPGGLARVRLSDWSVRVYTLPQVVHVIRRVDDLLYIGTSDGVYRLGPRGLDRIAIRRTAEGGYRVTIEP